MESTTPLGDDGARRFRVTHPYHPQVGREFELVTSRHNWGEERVYYHDDGGRLRSIPACWTSISRPDPYVVISAGRSWFCVEDLLELAKVVGNWKGSGACEGVK